jgi:FKBP-type peptidyl-prolyl cis-trans isomerase
MTTADDDKVFLPMRRIAVLTALPLLAVGVLAGCGGSSSNSSAAPAVSVSGAFGKAPAVTIPAQQAGSKLTIKTLVHGTGQAFSKTDAFVGNYAIYLWSGTSHKLLQSTFKTGGRPTLFAGTLLPGLERALLGQKMGSRVLAVIPPKEGFGPRGDAPARIKGTDTLVFVVDMIKDFAGNASAAGQQVSHGGSGLPTVAATAAGAAPAIKMPGGKPPADLTTKVLIKGTGPAVAGGDEVVVQYVGAIWRNGYQFDSSWKRSQPFGFPIGASPSYVIPGWDKGLAGQTVGSRVMLVIPPADGYGKTGSPQAHIKPNDTLVFVVDILGAFGTA